MLGCMDGVFGRGRGMDGSEVRCVMVQRCGVDGSEVYFGSEVGGQ